MGPVPVGSLFVAREEFECRPELPFLRLAVFIGKPSKNIVRREALHLVLLLPLVHNESHALHFHRVLTAFDVLLWRDRLTDTIRLETRVDVKGLLILATSLIHNVRHGIQAMGDVFRLIEVDQEREEGLAPLAEFLIQFRVARIYIRLLEQQFGAVIGYELGLERNDLDAAPSAVVHGRHRRKTIAHHADLTHDTELLLVAIEGTGLYHVLTRELLHATRVDRLLVVGLLHIDKSAALGRHDIWIRRARVGALSGQHSGLHGRLVVPEREAHEFHQFGLAIATHTCESVVTLLSVRTLQTGRKKAQGVAAEFGVRKEFGEEIGDLGLARISGIIGNVIDRLCIRIILAGQKGDIVLGAALAEHYMLLSICAFGSQFQNSISAAEEEGVGIQFVVEFVLAELLGRHLHYGLGKAAAIELELDLLKVFRLFQNCVSKARIVFVSRLLNFSIEFASRFINLPRDLITDLRLQFETLIQFLPHVDFIIIFEPIGRLWIDGRNIVVSIHLFHEQ